LVELIANAYVVASLDVVGLNDFEKGMFGVVTLLEKSSQGALVIRQLSLFLKLCIPPSACVNLLCHDLNFGFRPKKGMERCGLRVQAKSHIHTLENVRECEGMSPNTPKWILTLGVRVFMEFQIFREQFEGSKLIKLKFSLYHWKVLKT